MKKTLLSIVSAAFATLTFVTTNAQYYNRAPISSGFNADVIANGTGPSASSTTIDVDGVSFAFVSKDFMATATSPTLAYGLPVNGIFTSAVTTTPGLSYELASYSSNNTLRLSAVNDTGTLALTTPVASYNLYILATSGSGTSTLSAVINFTDGTSQTATGLAVGDWYNTTGFAIQGIGRINRTNDNLEDGGGTNPRLYQIPVTINVANQAKLVQSVAFTKTAGSGISNIFALSVNKYTTCPAPSALTAGSITQNGATISFTAPTPAPSNGYQLYYSTSNVSPTDATPASITNITGLSAPVTSLSPNTIYYIWGRSVCGTPGPWGFSATFKTLCGPVTSLSENLDSYTTGNIVPDCWARLVSGTGTMSISATAPVSSGNRHLYQSSSTVANSSVVVLPEFSNINAGTHRLKFKGRSSSTTGSAIQVGYVTDATSAASFVSLFAFDVTNTTYTDLASQRSFVIPNTVPATARLAVKNTGTKTGGFYWDDVVWEAAPVCIEPYNPVKTNSSTSSISLSWTAPSPAPATYDIFYSTTNTPPTGASTPQITGVTTTSNTVGSLTASTTYYFWIRSNCGTSQSSWIGPVTGYTGVCLPTGGASSTTYYLQTISTTGGTNNISYNATMYNAYTDNSATSLSSYPGGIVNYNLASSAGTNYHYIWVDYNNDLDFDDTGETILATTTYTASSAGNFTIPATQAIGNYRIRFAQSYSGNITSCGPAPYGSYVDYTLNINATPSCGVVTGVTATNPTTTSASVSWSAPANIPSSGYQIYYSTSNVAPTASTAATQSVASGTTATITPLTPNTTYYVWVRSNCGSGTSSDWSVTAATVTTLCNATTVPYNENFETAVTPAAPSCTNVINAGLGNNWYTSNNPGSGFTTNVLRYDYNSTNAANSWFFTQGIQLTAGTQYSVEFDYGDNTVDTYSENLKVSYGTTATVAGMTNLITDITGINTGTLTNGVYTFTPATTGVYYIGFNAHSDADQYYLYVDNIKVNLSTLGTSEATKKLNEVRLYPNPFVDILSISDIKGLQSVSIVDIAGRTVKTIAKPGKDLNVSDLVSGSYLVTLHYEDGSKKTIKTIKK